VIIGAAIQEPLLKCRIASSPIGLLANDAIEPVPPRLKSQPGGSKFPRR
jgi:hypothetical protein